jgi:carboxyl-terminal processing protease
LDYTHREGDDVPKFDKNARNSFKTKNGRTVYDGGGIAPDVVIEKPLITKSTEALLKSDAIFNFASNYYYHNPSIPSPEEFVFKEDQYDAFISFLTQGENNFETKSENKFKAAFDLSEKENLSEGIQTSYLELTKQLETQKLNELSKNKQTIKELLSDEIINRYYYKKGEYQNDIVFSPFIKEAIAVLENENQYRSILNNESN